MIAALLPDTLSQSDRRYYFKRVAGAWFGGALVIMDRKTRAAYAVDEEEVCCWVGVEVRRFLVKKVKSDDVYGVSVPLDPAAPPRCNCIGHNVHKNCKHADTLASLVRDHALPDLTRPEEP